MLSRSCRFQEVANIVTWLENLIFWKSGCWGEIVATGGLTVLKEPQQKLTCTTQKILPSIFHYCEILFIENIKNTARRKTMNSRWTKVVACLCLCVNKETKNETEASACTLKNIRTIQINMIIKPALPSPPPF